MSENMDRRSIHVAMVGNGGKLTVVASSFSAVGDAYQWIELLGSLGESYRVIGMLSPLLIVETETVVTRSVREVRG